jgi:hypothetical protein
MGGRQHNALLVLELALKRSNRGRLRFVQCLYLSQGRAHGPFGVGLRGPDLALLDLHREPWHEVRGSGRAAGAWLAALAGYGARARCELIQLSWPWRR